MAKGPKNEKSEEKPVKQGSLWLTEEDYEFYKDLPGEYKTPEIRGMLHEFEKWRDAHSKRKSRNGVKFISYNAGYIEKTTDPDISAEDRALDSIESQMLWAAIDKLPPVQRRRLVAHYFYGKSYREIAHAEGVAFNAITKSLAAAIEQLRRLIKEFT